MTLGKAGNIQFTFGGPEIEMLDINEKHPDITHIALTVASLNAYGSSDEEDMDDYWAHP